MIETPVRFTTAVDCCKRFMQSNSGLPLSRINPMVGDSVRVYHDSNFILEMKVLSRNWELTNGSSPTLICQLGVSDFWQGENFPKFIKMMRDKNFS